MFELALTFILAAFVSAGVSFFGIAGDASGIVSALALVFAALSVLLLGTLAFAAISRRSLTH